MDGRAAAVRRVGDLLAFIPFMISIPAIKALVFVVVVGGWSCSTFAALLPDIRQGGKTAEPRVPLEGSVCVNNPPVSKMVPERPPCGRNGCLPTVTSVIRRGASWGF